MRKKYTLPDNSQTCLPNKAKLKLVPWMAEPFWKWGGPGDRQKYMENFCGGIYNCDVTSIEIWRH